MKRKLRPSIRTALTAITTILVFMLAGLDDFTLGAIPMILGAMAVIGINVKILENF